MDQRMKREIERTGAYLRVGNQEWSGWHATGIVIASLIGGTAIFTVVLTAIAS